MGSLFSTAAVADHGFLNEDCHKIYVVTSPNMDVFKLGYTGQTLRKGVWNAYRRAYGKELIIYRVYKAAEYREDDAIHNELIRFRKMEAGREIYSKKNLAKVIKYLDHRYNNAGVGPFLGEDVFSRFSPKKEKLERKKSDSWVFVEYSEEGEDIGKMMNGLSIKDVKKKKKKA